MVIVVISCSRRLAWLQDLSIVVISVWRFTKPVDFVELWTCSSSLTDSSFFPCADETSLRKKGRLQVSSASGDSTAQKDWFRHPRFICNIKQADLEPMHIENEYLSAVHDCWRWGQSMYDNYMEIGNPERPVGWRQ